MLNRNKTKDLKKKVLPTGFALSMLFVVALTFSTEEVKANELEYEGEATVSCKDVENYGSGVYRARICGAPSCSYNDHGPGATSGTCTIQN